MIPTLKKAEEHRSENASVTTFMWVGRQHGYDHDLLVEVSSDVVDDIGYRELELADTQEFLDFWTGFKYAYDSDNTPCDKSELDLSGFKNVKLIAFK